VQGLQWRDVQDGVQRHPDLRGRGLPDEAIARDAIIRSLRYSINVTLDGCCDHRTEVPPNAVAHASEPTIADGNR